MQFEKIQKTVVKEILSVRNATAQRTFRKYGGLYVLSSITPDAILT
jgi:drug/metabolite transporter superfamily protein YnfA